MFKQLSPEQAGQRIVEQKATVMNNRNWDVRIRTVYDDGSFDAYFRHMENPDIGFESTYHQVVLPETIREHIASGLRFHWHDTTIYYRNGLRDDVTNFCVIPPDSPLNDEFAFTNADTSGYEKVAVSEEYL